jgi:Domain of unknown function (DUF5011)
MKKVLLSVTALLTVSSLIFTGCKKDDDDTNAPTIELNGGDTTVTKGSLFSDPGATAFDDVDETVTVTSNFASVLPNTNSTGVYEISYTATDEAGNTGYAERTVTVSYSGAQIDYTYNVNDTAFGTPTTPSTYQSVVSTSSTGTYAFNLTNLSGVFTGNTIGTIVGSDITLPTQKPNGSTSNFEVSGTGKITQIGSQIRLDLFYNVKNLTSGNVTPNHFVGLSL